MANPAVVILCHDRIDSLERSLRNLLALPDASLFAVYVSIDAPSAAPGAQAMLKRTGMAAKVAGVWVKPALGAVKRPFQRTPLSKISEHFRFALENGLSKRPHSHLILLEDDLDVAPDFLTMFRATAWLLDADPTLYCVSAWNDNGVPSGGTLAGRGTKALLREDKLFRTGYFPGLGWMLTGKTWNEVLRKRWPEAPTTGWDHWIRLSESVDGRECLAPEVPRTRHVSKHGTNVNSADEVHRFAQFAFSQRKGLSPSAKPWDDERLFGDLAELLLPAYQEAFRAAMDQARFVANPAEFRFHQDPGDYILAYNLEVGACVRA